MVLIESFEDLRPGLVVESLTYYSFDFSLPLSQQPTFDEAADVVLDFSDGTVARFTWYMSGYKERLTIGSHAMPAHGPLFTDDPEEGAGRRRIDATDRWSMSGLVLEGYELVYGESTEGLSEPWSCRLDFDKGRSLVVALGEYGELGEPIWMPDSLLVTSDRAVAESYRPIASEASSWGSAKSP